MKVLCLCALLLVCSTHFSRQAFGQTGARPILVSDANSTRALALDALAQTREPFSLSSPLPFTPDRRTRVMLFAMNLNLQAGETSSAVTVEAEDAEHHVYPLTVEYVGPVPEQSWTTAVVVRLNDEMGDVGDVLVRLTYHGQSSNRVRLGIGHTGGGLPDDPGAVPTPGTIAPQPPANTITAGNLTADDVKTLISQAVSAAVALNKRVAVVVTDKEGNVLGNFTMTGTTTNSVVRGGGGPSQTPDPFGRVPVGLEGMTLRSYIFATSKAGTASLFGTQGNAFTSRTASFIIQEHFPPGVDNQPGGPLYGVQYSSLLCSDINPRLPVGLSGDPGGMPVYKNGVHAGGIGIEGDGIYTIDKDPSDFDVPFEELIAVSAVRGYETPSLIRADNILVNGLRLPFVNVAQPITPPTIPFDSLPGTSIIAPRGAQPSLFVPATVGGISGEVDPRFFSFRADFISPPRPNALTATDVNTIISHAAQQANITRAAIRQPLGSSARVSIAVVDANGNVLGIFRTADAPVFGFDVSVQKARGAAFFSRRDAGEILTSAGFSPYVARARADGVTLDAQMAMTTRTIGFLHRPFYPDGINGTAAGPFSKEFPEWSVFNVGLQLDLVKGGLEAAAFGFHVSCSSIHNLANGTQIFAGSVPLYKNGVLAGAIGVSGDGIDQDDIIAAAGAAGFTPAPSIRADQFIIRGARLPFVKFPRSPNL